MKKIILFLGLVLCLSCKMNHSFAQKYITNKKTETYVNSAQEFLFARNYTAAIEQLNLAIKQDPKYIPSFFTLASIYLNQYKDYKMASQLYDKILLIEPENQTVLFNQALCQFYLKEFETAEKLTTEFIANNPNNKKDLRLANQILKNIRFSKIAIQNPVSIEYKNLGASINSDKNEYFPSITSDNEFLYFTQKDNNSPYATEDIFYSQYVNKTWQTVKKLNSSINSTLNEGAHCISSGGKYLLFASDNYKYQNQGKFDLFLARKSGDKFLNPINLGKNVNSIHWDSQPVLSADSKTLFFVSKRRDGLGGSDIYISRLTSDGVFGPAENLGNTINTSFDEQRPYLHPDGKTLYFASSGHAGMGGADLYKSTLQDDGTWSKPTNLGYPINTSEDEFGIFVSADGQSAFISSDREGGFGGQDIYSFQLPKSVQPDLVSYIKGMVVDKESNKPLQANIKIFDIDAEGLYKSLSSDKLNGTFLTTIIANQNYAFEVLAEGYLPFSENVSIANLKNNESFIFNIKLEKILAGKEFTMKNIFFETNAYDLLEASKVELNYLLTFLNENKNTKLEVGGHTDDVGSSENNLTLSENRAKSVYNYLIEKGISDRRLSYKGYGEQKPIVQNDSEKNRAKNRRTSFLILQN